MNKNLLEVRKLNKIFNSRFGAVHALNNVSFNIQRGEVMGLIGQSGSGKTTVANALMHLLKDVTGVVTFDGKVVSGKLRGKELKAFYRRVQKIFQDPSTSLNERQNVFSILSEPIKVHKLDRKWIRDFKQTEAIIHKTFRLSLEQKFLQTQIDFLNFKSERIFATLDQITADLSVANEQSALQGNESANEFSNFVASYFDPLIDYERSVLNRLSTMTSNLLAFYFEAQERIKRRDLPWDEVALLDAEDALSEYVNSYSDKKIIEKEKQLLAESKEKGAKLTLETKKIIIEIIRDHRNQAKALRNQAHYTTTRVERAKLVAISDQHKHAVTVWQSYKLKKYAIDRDALFQLDEKLLEASSSKECHQIGKQHEIIFESKTKETFAQFKREADEIIVEISLKKGEMHQPKPERVRELSQVRDRAEAVFRIELVKAESEFAQFKTNAQQQIKFLSKKLNDVQIKSRRTQLDNVFKKWLKLNLGGVKNASERKRRTSIVKAKENSLYVHQFEQKGLERMLNNLKVVYRLNERPVLNRYRMIKRLLVEKAVMDSLKNVGLKPEHAYRYPHEFSGGQKQRINIARALILEPDLIIADEPIASLDVSIQAQVINLLIDLVRKKNISMIFIGHDLSVVRYVATSVCVMHLGRIVERGLSEPIFDSPLHPYTQTLFSAIPKLSDAHLPFKAPNEKFEYLQEYKVSAPRDRAVSPTHDLLSNEEQFKKWTSAFEAKRAKPKPEVKLELAPVADSKPKAALPPKVVKKRTSKPKVKAITQPVVPVVTPVTSPAPKVKVRKPAAPASKDIYIEYRDGKWFVNSDGARAHKSFELQKDAIIYARSMARPRKGTVHVKNRDGKVRLSLAFDDKKWKGEVHFDTKKY